MLTFVVIVHIFFSFSLIALVLLQDPKGGNAGIFGGGGGGSNSLLGATGQTTFFAKLTRWSAVIFGITCITMTIIGRQNAGSVIDSLPAPTSSSAPAPSPSGPGPGGTPTQPTVPADAPASGPGAAAAATSPATPTPATPPPGH